MMFNAFSGGTGISKTIEKWDALFYSCCLGVVEGLRRAGGEGGSSELWIFMFVTVQGSLCLHTQEAAMEWV